MDMKYYVVSDSSTNEILRSYQLEQFNSISDITLEANEVAYEVDIQDQRVSHYDGTAFTAWADGYIPKGSLAQYRVRKTDEIMAAYLAEVSGSVSCLVNGTSYEMNAGLDAASKLKSGYDLAILLGETTMDIVDFSNSIHLGVAVADVLEIVQLMSIDYRDTWSKKATLVAQIDAASTYSEVDVIFW